MAWLKIDSRLYSHPVALQVKPAAMGLWLLAGCWLAEFPQQGNYLPDHTVKRIARGMRKEVAQLVEAGLWVRVANGYEMYHRMDLGGSGLRDDLWSTDQLLVRRKSIPAALRQAIYERDEYACVECGALEDLSLDHIYPWSLGGEDTEDNLRTLCRPCNSSKGARV